MKEPDRVFRTSNRLPKPFSPKFRNIAKRESHALTGLATGFRDLDEKTSGLQPNRFNYRRGSSVNGKNGFVSNIGAKCRDSWKKRSSRFFRSKCRKSNSLCVCLSSEARVDAHRFRTGYLTRDEWGRLAEAIGTLSEAKIFIDDTPGISVLEMRAKTRRLVCRTKKTRFDCR